MKNTFTIIALLAICFIFACNKETDTASNASAPQVNGSTGNNYNIFRHSTARYAGSNYSQSIPVDSANSMIQSYLTSVHYSTQDTALRSLSFDADTLRAYLLDPNIVTIKFMLAHQPAYKNGGHDGEYAGMRPDAITMIIVGLNSSDNYILNSRNQVYEHIAPCPSLCPGISNVLIQ